MVTRDERYLVRVRLPFQVLGILFTLCGILATAILILRYDDAIISFGFYFVVVVIAVALPFALFIGLCSVTGHMPYCLAKRLPDQMLYVIKDLRNIDHRRVQARRRAEEAEAR